MIGATAPRVATTPTRGDTRIAALRGAIILVTLAAIAFSVHLRWSLAHATTWHCDEIPLLARFTSLGGVATTEAEARRFEPSLYSLKQGTLRSLRVPDYQFTVHTTSGFWTNLTFHLFGYSLASGRAMPLVFSLLAIAAVAWAVRLAGGGSIAAALSAIIVAMSPYNVVYGAQARGYSEALALSALLIALVEWFRRRPHSWARAACVAMCAVQLSLTVYTMWMYWAFPAMALACVLAPRGLARPDDRVAARTVLVGALTALSLMMALYTAERFKQLQVSSTFGDRVGNFPEALTYISGFMGELLPAPAWIGLIGCLGMLSLLKGPARWWAWVFAVGIALPLIFASLTGSAGFKRNFIYILTPIAILFGLGCERLFAWACTRWRREWVLAATLAGVGSFALSASAALPAMCERLLRPDWGAVTMEYAGTPPRFGPRWFCPCLANHWQINWYQPKVDPAVFMNTPIGGTIDVVMGAQIGDDGRPKVYRHDPVRGAIRESALPKFLARIAPPGVRHGVESREWTGVRIAADFQDRASADAGAAHDPDRPVLIFAIQRKPITAEAWNRFLTEGGAHDAGLIAFKETTSSAGVLQSYVAPANRLLDLTRAMTVYLDLQEADMAFYRLDTASTSFSGVTAVSTDAPSTDD